MRNRLGARTDTLLDAVDELLLQRHRASRAIEGFNAALRPFLYFHKNTSALATLIGTRVDDWLSEPGFAPSLAVH